MADGSVIIDTKIDSKGINTGTKVITQQLKAISVAIGGAFSAAAVAAFVKDAVDSFGVMGSEYGQRIRMIETSLMRLRGVVAMIFNSLLSAAAPFIIQAIQGLITMLTTLAQVTKAMLIVFLGADAVTGALKAAGDAQGRLTNQTDRWAKSMKGAVAGFDELKVLDQKPVIPGVEVPTGMIDQVQAFKDQLMAFMQPVTEAFDRLVKALTPLGETIWAALKWAWDNILVPMGDWIMKAALPVIADLLGAAGKTLDTALIALKPVFEWLWEKFLKPLGTWAGEVFIGALKWITEQFDNLTVAIANNQEIFQTIMVVIGAVILTLFAIANPVIIVIAIIVALIAIIDALIKSWPQISAAARAAWDWVVNAWNMAGAWFMLNVINPIKGAFQSFIDWVASDPVRTALTSVLSFLGSAWETTFNNIETFVKGSVNNIIDFINGMIQSVVGGVNSVIGAMNSLSISIPDWVPGIGGQSWGMNLGYVSAPQLPRLATGAVIPPNAAFAAILGDQSAGRNIETPEGLLRQIFQEELGNIQVTNTLNITGSMAALVREMKPALDSEVVRIGAGLIRNATTNPINAGGAA